MAIPYEYRERVRENLQQGTKLTEGEIERLITGAYYKKKECGDCWRAGNFYGVSKQHVAGHGLLKSFFSKDREITYCLSCGSLRFPKK